MKKILLFNLLSVFSQFINIVKFPVRSFYISKLISNNHREGIYDAINEYNSNTSLWDELIETNYKNQNHIRIQYSRGNNGIKMLAGSQSNGDFEVYNTIIEFSSLLNKKLTKCVILHEIGHAFGLSHNEKKDSIMNSVFNHDREICEFSLDDILNLYEIQNL